MRIMDMWASNGVLYELRVFSTKSIRKIINILFGIDGELTKNLTDSILNSYASDIQGKIMLIDSGCGTGQFLSEIHENFKDRFSLVGVDYSKGIVRHAKKNGFGHFFCVCSADALPFKKKIFDISTMNFVFHHLPVTMHEDTMDELVRVARKRVLIKDVARRKTIVGKLFRIYWGIWDGGFKYRTHEEWHSLFGDRFHYKDYLATYPDYICDITLE